MEQKDIHIIWVNLKTLIKVSKHFLFKATKFWIGLLPSKRQTKKHIYNYLFFLSFTMKYSYCHGPSWIFFHWYLCVSVCSNAHVYRWIHSLIFKGVLNRFSHVQVFATPWTVACQSSLPLGFSRQEYWCGLPCPPPGDLPNTGTEPVAPGHCKSILYPRTTWETLSKSLLFMKTRPFRLQCLTTSFPFFVYTFLDVLKFV